ncbi:hypothetical protein PRZ48_000635 [Zasmidium cellare]|uniref:Tetratricopeptide repeat protein n=1 Tax=Zasmidium cellare TaxID=395010 RepID=A0ABR0EZI9_ZASCE|nr:hypothetical protein PRZ48_000635 [Zasmidium cellare]
MADNTYADLDNESRTYIALHDAMMNHYFDKNYKECVRLAEQLLTKPAAPDLIHARCHMMLSLRKDAAAVGHAEEAVALIEGMRVLVSKEEFPQEQLDEARRLLQAAKDRMAKGEGGMATAADTGDVVVGDAGAGAAVARPEQSAKKSGADLGTK